VEVILRKDVPKLGKRGDKKTVSDGYARNYLIPRGLAILATEPNLKEILKQEERRQAKLEKELQEQKELAHKLEGLSVTITRKVAGEDKLFGSVSNADIAKALEEAGIKIDKSMVILKEHIKTLGTYPVNIKLSKDAEATINVWVVKEEETS
jgi:large subunit ribosomal protein L9